MRVIFIPGLGADKRLFSLLKIEGINAEYVSWVKPGNAGTMNEYLPLLQKQVAAITEEDVLVGVSLGGIAAMEWRELLPVKKTILISSVKCSSEIPSYLKIFRIYNAYRFVRSSWLKKGASLVKPFISDTRNHECMQLFKSMLKEADEEFISWGIGSALKWQRKEYDKSNLVHIHGTADHLFPIRNIRDPEYTIKGGAHDMVMSKASEISQILIKELAHLK
jgi:pimeloyl-ACP methyl ester carboxylesterase